LGPTCHSLSLPRPSEPACLAPARATATIRRRRPLDPAQPASPAGAVGLVVGAYLIPLLAGTGALPSESAAEWTDGFFSEVRQRIGGPWLRVWIQAAAAMSNMGLFEAEMSGDSFQLLGMAEMGMIPAIFARR